MTLLATIFPHGIRMGQMTILTGLDQTMECMARCALKFGMNTRVILQLGILLCMAGQAGRRDVFGKFYFQRSVRVNMAPQAIFQGKMFMRFSFVTTITIGYNLHIGRRMAAMAVQTDVCMRFPLVGQDKNNIFMTFPAITFLDGCLNCPQIFFWHGSCRNREQKKYKYAQQR